MALPTITVDTLLSHPIGVCDEYPRELIESFFATEEFTALDILNTTVPKPDGSQVPIQDRLYHILLPSIIGSEAVEEIDAWVEARWDSITPATAAGESCKAQVALLDSPFKRANMLAELMRYEGLEVAELTDFIRGVLEEV